MEILSIPETKSTPKIHFDLISGVFELKGVSIPEYPKEFYEPLLEAIDRYSYHVPYSTTINISLVYFNSGSIRYLYYILKTFIAIPEVKVNLLINWYYDLGDEDQLDTARDIEDVLETRFNFIGVPPEKF